MEKMTQGEIKLFNYILFFLITSLVVLDMVVIREDIIWLMAH